jgi:tRNA pseudouridine32 synthase/23S rRNA pseudouridine746 synthase
MDTSGCLVLARSPAAAKELGRQFAARAVGKTYVAVVHGHVARDRGVVDLPLRPDPHDRPKQVAGLACQLFRRCNLCSLGADAHSF